MFCFQNSVKGRSYGLFLKSTSEKRTFEYAAKAILATLFTYSVGHTMFVYETNAPPPNIHIVPNNCILVCCLVVYVVLCVVIRYFAHPVPAVVRSFFLVHSYSFTRKKFKTRLIKQSSLFSCLTRIIVLRLLLNRLYTTPIFLRL